MIKVCINDLCEEVAHNCEKQETHCRSCGFILNHDKKLQEGVIIINQFGDEIEYRKEFVKPFQARFIGGNEIWAFGNFLDACFWLYEKRGYTEMDWNLKSMSHE